MERQGTDRNNTATANGADYFRNTAFPVVKFAIEPAEPMRTRKDAERAIGGPAIVEVNPYRDHLSEDFGRRLHLPNAGLLRPRHESRNVAALFDSNDIILVPSVVVAAGP